MSAYRSPSRLSPTRRSSTAGMVAGLAVFAVLCQLTLALPALLFMAAEHAWYSRVAVAALDHRHGDSPAPARHDHEVCARYQTGLAVALPAAAVAFAAPHAPPVASEPTIPEDRPAAAVRVAYQSRAPPTTA